MYRKIITACMLIALTLTAIVPAYAITNKQEQWFKLMDDLYVGAGMGIDQDDVEGAQCVDVASNYASYIFPVNNHKYDYKLTLNWGNAKDLYDNAYPQYFEKIPYAQGVIPKRGDIVVWGGPLTLFGHVGVVADADENGMTVVDQSGSLQNGVHKGFEAYGYSSYMGALIGFLRPREHMIAKLNPGVNGQPYNDDDFAVLSRGSDIRRPEEILELEKAKNTSGYNAACDLGLMDANSGLPPATELTRLQAAVLVLRAASQYEAASGMGSSEISDTLNVMADAKAVPNWGKNYAAYAIKNGLISGVSLYGQTPKFLADDSITGRQFATILMRSTGNPDVKYASIAEDFARIVGSSDESNKFINDSALSRDGAGSILFSFIKHARFDSDGELVYERLIKNGVIDDKIFANLK